MKFLNRSWVRGFLFVALMGSSVAYAAPSTAVSSGPKSFGLGIVLGEPTGISAKSWLSSDRAVDFGLAFSFDSYVLIFSDYLVHFPGAFSSLPANGRNEFTPYVGVGGVLAIASDRHSGKDRHFFGTKSDTIGLGVRVPLGVEWIPPRAPIGVFLEIVPGISIIPSTSGFVEAGIGIRYYF